VAGRWRQWKYNYICSVSDFAFGSHCHEPAHISVTVGPAIDDFDELKVSLQNPMSHCGEMEQVANLRNSKVIRKTED
jgi:hypothetical protein